MRVFIAGVALIASCVLAWPAAAQAQEENRDAEEAPRRPVIRERIMRAFDRDEDGRLNEEEQAAARRELGERFEEVRERIREGREERRDRPEGRRDDGDSPRAEARRDADGPPRDRERPFEARARLERRFRMQMGRGPGGPGPGGPRGPLGPIGGRPEQSLQPLFGWFDNDGDNMLSRREFAALSQFVEQRRPGRPDGPPGPRLGRRGGPDGLPARGDAIRRRLREQDADRPRDEARPRRPENRPDRRREREGRPGPERPDRPRQDRDRDSDSPREAA